MKLTPALLLLPLAWVPLGFAEQAPQPPTSAHGWRQSQKTDAARAMTYTQFTLVGKFLTSPQNVVSDRPAMVLDCIPATESPSAKGRFLAANLLVGTTLKIVYVEPEEIHGTSYFAKIAVRYRIDDGKEGEEKWSAGPEKTSASIPKEALKKMLRARSVAITSDDDRESHLAMQFDMPDPALVEKDCDVDYHK